MFLNDKCYFPLKMFLNFTFNFKKINPALYSADAVRPDTRGV